MDNVQEDFVTDSKGVKRSRVPKIRSFDTRWCGWTREEDTADFNLLRATRREDSEQKLASSLNRGMHSADWHASLERLSSRGYIVVIQREWGYKNEWLELADDKKKIRLTAGGLYFASQTLAQLGVDE